MKKIVFLLLLALYLTACSEITGDDSGGSGYEFTDQNLQGQHTGSGWELSSGYAEDWFGEDWLINLYDTDPAAGSDPWDFGAYSSTEYRSLMISIPKTDGVGVYNLNLDFNDADNSFTVTFYNTTDSMNTVASDGRVEILEIDTGNGTISGRMNVIFDSEYEVNGNFEVSIDPSDL